MSARKAMFTTLPVLLVFLSVACDDTPPLAGSIPVHPVTGTVLVKGQPAADVQVTFHPANSAPKAPSQPGESSSPIPSPSGKTNAEGKFQLHTYFGNDGAPVGEYTVSLSFAGSAETRDIMSKNQTTANVKIPAKYADPKKSGLVATVKEGNNEIAPFEIK